PAPQRLVPADGTGLLVSGGDSRQVAQPGDRHGLRVEVIGSIAELTMAVEAVAGGGAVGPDHAGMPVSAFDRGEVAHRLQLGLAIEAAPAPEAAVELLGATGVVAGGDRSRVCHDL